MVSIFNASANFWSLTSLFYFSVRTMFDAERDQVDGNAQAVMRTCGDDIRQFRADLTRFKLPPQVEEHRSITISMIDTYLKVVCKIFSEMKGEISQ